MSKDCQKCFSKCANEAYICHSCGFQFSKSRRVWSKVVNIASVISLFFGLLVIIINQSTQIADRFKSTEFTALGMQTAQGSNHLLSDNYALAIDSGTGVILDKLTFSGNGNITSKLGVSFLHGRAYKSSDIAIVRMDPTAIHLSYRPVPIEAVNAVLESGISESQIADLFKVRPTHIKNRLYKRYSWAVIPGRLEIEYFEPQRNSSERLTQTKATELLLWGRKEGNMRQRLQHKRYANIDIDIVVQKYIEALESHGNDSSHTRQEEP